MATETSIQAARTKIERLIAEIAALAKAEIASNEFFQKFIERVVNACDAKGGAVWLINATGEQAQSEFRLSAQVDFESSAFQNNEEQRGALLRILNDVVRNKHSIVFSPESAGEAAPVNGTRNRTPYPFVHVPLCVKDQAIGALQVWLQPYVQPANYAEFATFLGQLAAYVEQHLQSRRLGSLVLETQRLQQLLRFTTDLAGTLDAAEMAKLVANYGRDLVGCERCSVLIVDGDVWRVAAISGQEVVEKKSAMVKAMSAFVGAHSGTTTQVLSKQELLEASGLSAADVSPDAPVLVSAKGADLVDIAYFQVSHVVSAAVVPLLDSAGKLIGALFFESSTEGFFSRAGTHAELPPTQRVAEWIGTHSSKAIIAAREYSTLPFLNTTKAIREGLYSLRKDRRRRFLVRSGVFLAIVLGILLWPAMVKVDGDCVLVSEHRAMIVPEIPARVERVLVREGESVKKGQVLAELDVRRLETELAASQQNRQRYLAEADRYRAAPLLDEASAQVALMQARTEEQNEKRIRTDIESAKLRAPIDGVVVSKDLDLRVGEYLQPGTPFIEVDSLEDWELQLAIDEQDIAMVERGLKENGALDVHYILYAHSSSALSTQLVSEKQISVAAFPKLKQNLFTVTIRDLKIPPELKGVMRPQLTGRGSIELHRRPFAWKLAYKFVRWFRLKFFA